MKRIAVNDGRVFYSPRSYFWPIMQDELSRTPTLIQIQDGSKRHLIIKIRK